MLGIVLVRDQKQLSSTIPCRRLGGSADNSKKRTCINICIIINNVWFSSVNFSDGFEDILCLNPQEHVIW